MWYDAVLTMSNWSDAVFIILESETYIIQKVYGDIEQFPLLSFAIHLGEKLDDA